MQVHNIHTSATLIFSLFRGINILSMLAHAIICTIKKQQLRRDEVVLLVAE